MLKGSLRSETMWTAIIVGVLGAIIATMPMIQDQIPKESYGFIFMALSIIIAVLRIKTTMPLDKL